MRLTDPGEVEEAVRANVECCEVIDLHTHLFPPSHGNLMLYGIDELLTYHYLVSEFFMVAPMNVTKEAFFKLSKQKQADLIWDELFVKRLPISEAQLGVLTTLQMLGLEDYMEKKDLDGIRAWYAKQDIARYAQRVFKIAGVKYAVMTNVPFDENEAQYFRDNESGNSADQDYPIPPFLKTALRIDPLLKGDWGTICKCLTLEDMPHTMDGCKDYLRLWARRIKPMYLMASTPADFKYGPGDQPRNEGWPTATQLINNVMVVIAKELNLPLALKIGPWRGMAPSLNPCGGGDGVVVADLKPLRELCYNNPGVKFLATVLSRVNQHELCVLAQKFRNLHLYGCWWYLNNPSIIEEMTKMRLEMLGSAFTAQHSDCRVLDQLMYKWKHSRTVIADVLVKYYLKLYRLGWPLTYYDIEKNVASLLGGSFEDFMRK